MLTASRNFTRARDDSFTRRQYFANHMRLMLTAFALVLALIVDQMWFDGHYRQKSADFLRAGLVWLQRAD